MSASERAEEIRQTEGERKGVREGKGEVKEDWERQQESVED